MTLRAMWLMMAVLALTLAACNHPHLTRSQAKAQLEHSFFVEDRKWGYVLLLRIGSVGNCEPNRLSDYNPLESDDVTAVLSATGYVSVRPINGHVWDVGLTERGEQNLAGEKYGHVQQGECDEWQVTIPLSRFDHLAVTELLQDGAHAKADVSVTFTITPVGMAVRKIAPTILLQADTRTFGDNFAAERLPNRLRHFLGDDLAFADSEKNTFSREEVFTLDKFSDGWKVSSEQVLR